MDLLDRIIIDFKNVFLGNNTNMVDILIVLILCLLIILWLFPESSSKSKETAQEKNHELVDDNIQITSDENDYDFLATHESLPAQFDIALAYLNMGQKDKALYLLNKLSQSMHRETRNKAMQILKKINN